MTTSILVTKLFIPPSRSELVHRSDLIKRLNGGMARKLTLIAAPAGFGKTTLVSEWVGDLCLDAGKESQPANRIAWLSLDEGDNDLVRFLTYFVTALNQMEGTDAAYGEGALGMLQSPQAPPPEAVLTQVINEIATLPDRIIFVLDDYHLIEFQPVHDALCFLLDNLPVQMHLVIATRADPLLPLARLRAQNQLTELRAADLRFTSSEAAEFLDQVMGLNLSEEDIAVLESRTEGWIAGLQLAALSLQGKEDASRPIQAFSGSHRFVLDYLIEEVLEQQLESMQSFLLQTAIVEQMTGSLCDALTGQCSGQDTLELLERGNLFIIPLDEERHWYRYHHLFADLLRRRLRQTQLVQMPTLHRQASEWYEHNGFVDKAIDHALEAEAADRAARLLEKHVDSMWQQGEHANLRRWLARLPEEMLTSKPLLCTFQAWYLFSGGQQEAGKRCLQSAEKALEPEQNSKLSEADRTKLLGRVAAIQASVASYQGDVPGIIQHAQRALDYLPAQDVIMRSTTAITLGNAYGFMGDMKAAYQARMEATKTSKAGGNTYLSIVAHLEVAITLREQGRLRNTVEMCEQQVEIAYHNDLSRTSVVGCLLAIWGEALAELGYLEEANSKTVPSIRRTRGGDLAMLGWSHLCLIRIFFSSGDFAAAQEIIQTIERIDRKVTVPPWITNQMAAWQVRIWLAQGNMDAASRWAQGRELVAGRELLSAREMDYFTLIESIVLVRTLLAEGRLEEVNGWLQAMLKAAEAGDRKTRMIEILNLQAFTAQADGDTARALAALERSLALAEPEGFLRTFVDEGPPMAKLLGSMREEGREMNAYVHKVLYAYSSQEQAQPSTFISQPLFESLSEREIEVLQLIAEGLTNREIADRLYLSLNTVKVHTRNIYGKLGVHNRTQAVAQAQAQRLLPRR